MFLRFHDDWKFILQHAWSIRFMFLAFVLSGMEVMLPIIQPYVPLSPEILGGASGIAAGAAFIARLVAQRNFEEAHWAADHYRGP
jgi:hypothetical protein